MFPDRRLREPAQPVASFDAALLADVDDLYATMLAAPGIGIAGPHIGLAKRIVVIQLADGSKRVYVNPSVVSSSADVKLHTEGSISMPGATEEIERPASVVVSYQDVEGLDRSEEAGGLLAVCLQHEIDQLDGVFWINRLSRLRRERLLKRFAKAQRG